MSSDVTGGPISPTQKNTIALMAVQGLPNTLIAAAVRRPMATIRRLIKEDSEVQARMTEYENRIVSTAAIHQFEMMNMMDRCREILSEGLFAPDLKVRLDTAKYAIDNTIPKRAERMEIDLNIEGQVEIGKHIPVIAESITEYHDAGGSNASFQKHIRQELPGPTTLEPAPGPEPVEE